MSLAECSLVRKWCETVVGLEIRWVINWLACVASVSSRIRRESWDESQKKKKGRGRGRGMKLLLETLATQAINWSALFVETVFKSSFSLTAGTV